MNQRINEYLVINDSSGEAKVQCTKCQHVLCSAKENYKEHALVSENPLTKIGPQYSDTKRFILREFYCPGCFALLGV
jgi:acetone carboxylase gamma subunit